MKAVSNAFALMPFCKVLSVGGERAGQWLPSAADEKQIEVARNVAAQVGSGSRRIFGVMVESHLKAGAQKFSPGKDDATELVYGQSITDACIGWEDSLTMLDVLSNAVKARRG